jgi:hypothetical protein
MKHGQEYTAAGVRRWAEQIADMMIRPTVPLGFQPAESQVGSRVPRPDSGQSSAAMMR